jgi:hypothetical protein
VTRITQTDKRVYLDDSALHFRDASGNEQGALMAEDGPPVSGTSGTGVGYAGTGTKLIDGSNGVEFINEGTSASPYWTPTSYDQAKLFGLNTDFRDGVGIAVADTATSFVVPGSGLRIFGVGLAETDSGAVAQTAGEGGTNMRLTASATDGKIIAIGTHELIMQPDQHKLLVADVQFTHVSAITLRATGLGFIGAAAADLAPPVTGATTTATFGAADFAGMFQDVGFTDADAVYLVGERADVATTQTGLSGSGSATLAAAATVQRWRIEVQADGTTTAFVNKAQIGQVPRATGAATHAVGAALDADEEVSPIFWVESTSAATKAADVSRFATWAYRTT